MTETNPAFPEFSKLPPIVRDLIPEGWTPPPIPEDTSVDPITYRTAEVWANFARQNLLWFSRRHVESSLSEDIVQETFLTYIQTHQRAAPKSVHGKLLNHIAGRRVVDSYRHKDRHPEDLYGSFDSEDFIADYGDPLQKLLEQQVVPEILQSVAQRAKLSKLEERLFAFAILELQTSEHLSCAQLAKQIGSSEIAARVARHRMRKKVREALQADTSGLIPTSSSKKHTSKSEQPITLAGLRAQTLNHLDDPHNQRKGQRHVVLPTYLSPWKIIAKDMITYLKDSAAAEAAGLIVYPHEQYIPLLTRQLGRLAGRKVCSLDGALRKSDGATIIIDTPKNVAEAPEITELPIHYVTRLNPAHTVPTAYKDGRPAFILTLGDEGGRAPKDAYRAPSYERAGGRKIQWLPVDSQNYLVEWQLRNGRPLTETDIHRIDDAGQGPGLRRICRGIGSFAAVQAMAGI